MECPIINSNKKQTMRQERFNKRPALRFKHFTRKGYALFSCLGREVIVGVLATSTLTYAKADGISTSTAVADDSLSREEVKLDEVIVTGSRAPLTDLQSAKMVAVISREDISHAAAATSISDVMKTITGVDVRQRGGFGVQTDISMRGGNFDHITFLLNGVNISSPHTGHLSADFPLSPDDIERIEVIEGPASRVFGASAFNGVINIITRRGTATPGCDMISAGLSAGSYGYAEANANLYTSVGGFSSNVSGGYTRSDGATANSAFSSSRFFWQGAAQLKKASVNAQVGYSYKPYEANTFYGAASTDQWESNERWMTALSADVELGKLHITPSVYWNRWYDHYQWHRDNPSGENYHCVNAGGGALGAWIETPLGKTSFGGELRRESIWSTKLGELQDEDKWKSSGGHDADDEIKYKYHDSRIISSAFLEHNILLSRWTVSLGATAIHTPFDGWGVYPGVDISWRPYTTCGAQDGGWKLFASWNMAMRLPTFTDLYYSGTGIEGNSNLKPEKTSDFQIGLRKTGRGYSAQLQLFYSHKTDMIDWVTYAEAGDDIFHSVNFRQNNWGGELDVSFLPRELLGEAFPLRRLTARYAYIDEDSEYDVTVAESKYAMEYLRNKVVLSADGRLWRKLSLSLTWRWQDRTGEGNSDYALLDGKLSWDDRHYSLFVDGSNLLGKKYYDYIYVEQPGFTFVAGVKVRW